MSRDDVHVRVLEGRHQTLEEAQRNKMDHVCRKVQLNAGETFVDIGSGWGGLLFHAWEHYGALGTGVNTTTEQVAETGAEIERRGLGDKIRVLDCDFREIPGQYDKLLSIGTLEHAGRDCLRSVVRAHAAALKPGGLGVIPFIGHVGARDTEFYIREYIFPGGWIPSLSQALDSMERGGLEVLDVENLRRHYALTLDAWANRFDDNWEEIHALDTQRFDERFRRIWRTYWVVRGSLHPGFAAQPVPGHRQQGKRPRQLPDEPVVPLSMIGHR
jgi:cyclopropane-fatty-acyl-phospholipid synthase